MVCWLVVGLFGAYCILLLTIACNVVSVVLWFGWFYGFNEWFVLFVYLVV